MASVAVIVPVFGRPELTDVLLKELDAETNPVAVYIVDNGRGYRPKTKVEALVAPDVNLGWARGCNLGMRHAAADGHDAYLLLNNDVRLSRDFVGGLVEAWLATGAALLGPVYDHNWPQQRCAYSLEAARYVSSIRERRVPFIDGTCMFLPADTVKEVGWLDWSTWPSYGWGCDKDYALRVREADSDVCVTERSYLNHFARGTASTLPGYSEVEAEDENDAGMASKWGPAWRDRLYAGFDGLQRLGLVQLDLRGSASQ